MLSAPLVNWNSDYRSEEELFNILSIANTLSARPNRGSLTQADAPRTEEIRIKQSALYLWKNVLTLLGNINEIKDPSIHEYAIKSAIEIWDTLAKVSQPTEKKCKGRPSISLTLS